MNFLFYVFLAIKHMITALAVWFLLIIGLLEVRIYDFDDMTLLGICELAAAVLYVVRLIYFSRKRKQDRPVIEKKLKKSRNSCLALIGRLFLSVMVLGFIAQCFGDQIKGSVIAYALYLAGVYVAFCWSFSASYCKSCISSNSMRLVKTELLNVRRGQWSEKADKKRFRAYLNEGDMIYDPINNNWKKCTSSGIAYGYKYRLYKNVKIGNEKRIYRCVYCHQIYSVIGELKPLENLSAKSYDVVFVMDRSY